MGRIVAGIDGSQGSRKALTWAVREAAARETILQPVIVWQSPAEHGDTRHLPVSDEQLAEEAAREQLGQVLEDVASQAPVTVADPQVVRGDPARVLCDRSASADLLVVGSRGLGGFAGLMLGSVSHKCAHHSRCPLIIVREGRAEDDHSQIRRILTGTDVSDGSRRALAWAADEAALRGASVEAVEVWADPYGGDMSLELHMEHFRAERIVLLERAEARLAATVAETAARHPGLDVVPVLLQGDDPAQILCERSADADLLVVGSRGHGGFLRLTLGSVGNACAHHSKCPVAIIPKARRAGRTGNRTLTGASP